MINEKSKIKNWYLQVFDDELGNEIKDDVTFYDVFYALDTYKDVYDVIGKNIDSIIRERIFEKLADIMGVEYNYIYDQWLRCN